MSNIGKLLTGCAALAVTTLWFPAAHAQIAASGANAGAISGSNSGSSSRSGSTSGAQSNAAATNAATASNGAQSSTGASSVTFNSGNNSPATSYQPSDVTIRSAPQIYVPNVVTGNVCALGASGGASWLGAGFAAGMSWESMQCERRQTAALLWNMGTPDSRAAAKAVVCNSPEIRAAYLATGSPCPADIAMAQAQPQPVQMQPVPVSVPRPMTAAEHDANLPRCTGPNDQRACR